MIWLLSDGTKVHLGGKVEGSTSLADKFREDAKRAKAGYPRAVCSLPSPGTERLDLTNAWHLDCWVRDEADRARALVIDAPEVKAPAEWDEPADSELGADPVH